MAIQIQLRSGTTPEHSTFTGAVGEVTVDTTKDTLVVHDGVTVGGFPVATRANNDGTISVIKKDGTVSMTIPANGLLNNTLTSTATNQAATAAQAKALKDLVDTKLTTTDTIANAEKLTTATGSAPSYSARAWVNFNGIGVVTIYGSGNVASITDNGVGDYTINFTTQMLDANYAVSLGGIGSFQSRGVLVIKSLGHNEPPTTKTAGALRVISVILDDIGLYDAADASVVIYR